MSQVAAPHLSSRGTRLRRALPEMFKVGVAEAVAYRGELLVWLLSTNTPIIMLLLWTAVTAEAPVGRYGGREITAYFLCTLIVRILTGAWVVWQMNEEIRRGTLAMRLLRPLHPFWAYATENLGAWPLRVVVVSPAIAFLILAYGEQLAPLGPIWLLFPVTLFAAWSVYFSAMLCVGALAFHWQRSLSLFEVWLACFVAFSGYIVPLDLFPAGLRAALDYTPFPYLVSLPVETMLGRYDVTTLLGRIGIQVAWCLLLLGIAQLLWRRGVRSYEAFGG